MSDKEKKELNGQELNDVSGGGATELLNDSLINPHIGGPGSCDPNWMRHMVVKPRPGGNTTLTPAEEREALKNWKTKKN